MYRFFLLLVFSLIHQGLFADEHSISAHLDLLYWKPREESLVLTTKKAPVFFTDNFTTSGVSHPHFDWEFGVRVGLGYLNPHSQWDVRLDWTRHHTRIDQHVSTNDNDLTNVNGQQGMFPIWALADDIIAGDYVSQADLNWKLGLDLIDLEFGRPFHYHHWLVVRPFVGLRNAWVKQHGDVDYRGGIFFLGIIDGGISINGPDEIRMKNNFWGLGPRLGVQPRFIVGKGFSICLEAAAASLGGLFNLNQRETFLGNERFSRRKHPVRLRWITDLAGGIAWDTSLCHHQYHLTFLLSWEYHLFFDQFELKKDAFHLVPSNRNLDVQGVTFSSCFNF